MTASILGDVKALIARDGPVPISTFMAMANRAYYGRGEAFGVHGDFITAPDISQTFGEMIGLWCAVVWQAMGAPYPFLLVECGPGRGTLMKDMLRATARVDGFAAAARIHLVEQSPALRESQAYALQSVEPHWHETFDSVPAGPAIVIGNEFLDALPIRQFELTVDGWRERAVALDDTGALKLSTIAADNMPIPIPLAAGAEIGAVFEHSHAVANYVDSIAGRLTRHGGAALWIDYGHKNSALGETLQAVRGHKYHPILQDPGCADLTAHVDFDAAAKSARQAGAIVHGPVEQGLWLRRLGIAVRLAQLAAGKPAAIADELQSGVRRLIEPDGMGAMFKVMAVTHPSLTSVDGFTQRGDDDHC